MVMNEVDIYQQSIETKSANASCLLVLKSKLSLGLHKQQYNFFHFTCLSDALCFLVDQITTDYMYYYFT